MSKRPPKKFLYEDLFDLQSSRIFFDSIKPGSTASFPPTRKDAAVAFNPTNQVAKIYMKQRVYPPHLSDSLVTIHLQFLAYQ
jgi:hypothetical protein